MTLPSYLEGSWRTGAGKGTPVADAVTGEIVTRVTSEGLDLAAAVAYARRTGLASLGELTFPQRAAALKAAALALQERKQELYDLSARAGATRRDAAVDVDGGIGTALVYASLARKGLPDHTLIVEDDPIPLGKGGTFAGRHVLTTPRGISLQINAFNFPVWGMLEKLAPALLAGLPTIVKPATPTAYIAAQAVRIIAGTLPPGAIQLVAGGVPGLLDLLGGQDHIGFTGSAATAARLRADPAVTRRSARFNAEADSLNCSVLGPDAVPGEPEFDLFADALVTEMTVKAGQKCTAIRRAFVPAHLMDAVSEAVEARLARVVVGAPGAEGVTMGALVGLAQRDDVRAAVARLTGAREAGSIVYGDPHKVEVVGADAERGAFLSPLLLRADDVDRPEPHEVEAFGPVSTLMPYRGIPELHELIARGEGSLAGSVVSHDTDFVRQVVLGAAAHHGRLLVLDRDSAGESTGHGTPMPQLVHGGPGRAGGGEEEGGLRAVHAHLQRTALQGGPEILDAIVNRDMQTGEQR
ncbi:oxepin-CoA hydrolase/3-oxo-5,6-dehydrosuberyl-CoA semialdehyde dehydrogenase [Nonomuraea polychroma]|uniref:Oxepin-CoA hydrolase/3-oxo-5,6-dehydrosuberyl-CoA semialdehyde dehydrogenase n=1 Tax=Nonomuraea polychroma TaxID=46176 RepID=A0A438LZ90_9ACTN|nr:phenylacetic acid degradation bifunctional protein PaaZ [Nonomuraea polychroma]RVX38721.1 oxepin-CoA hydrolase/3-oxo-5,6-dehydrosuberyl-CoA semialdehyde dehydrogenase [Nonomuraea polychroma]